MAKTKLTPAQRKMLMEFRDRKLICPDMPIKTYSFRWEGDMAQSRLPRGCTIGTIRALQHRGLVGGVLTGSYYRWQLTDAGRAALEECGE